MKTYLDLIVKTSKVKDWSAYKWGELDGSYYYFLKKDGDNLLEVTAPEIGNRLFFFKFKSILFMKNQYLVSSKLFMEKLLT